MRIRIFLAATLLTAACAGPRPCTRTLCPAESTGSYEIRGWSGAVAVSPGAPKPPVPSDSEISILTGEAEFTNGKTTVRALEGTTFRFAVSTRAVASIEVSTGSVSVFLSSAAAATTVLPGAQYQLPLAK